MDFRARDGEGETALNSEKILRVGLIQGGKIIEERMVQNSDHVTVGPDPKNTFVVPNANLPASFPIFERRTNQYHLVFTEKMAGRVRIGAMDVDFNSLRTQGLAKKRGNLFVFPLNENSKGKVSLGDITLLFQFVKPIPDSVKIELPPTAKGSFWQATDHLFFFILAGSLIIHFSGASYLACSPKAVEQELSLEELPDRFARVLIPTKAPEPKAAPKEEPSAGDKQEEKKEETASKTSKRGGGDAAARRADLQKRVASKGLLKILGSSRGGGGGAFQDVLGAGTGTGDIANALAGAGGVGVATVDSLARSGGPKGGGSGAVAGIGSVGTSGGGNVNLGNKGDVKVAGHVKDVAPEVESTDVDREALARYVRQRLKAIQNCYEKELKRNPSLKGKLLVRFSITPSGRAGEIEVEDNSLGNEAVAACLRTVIRGWIFPFKPAASVSVAYPFLFSPAS